MTRLDSVVIRNDFIEVEVLLLGATVKRFTWLPLNRNIIVSYQEDSDYIKNNVYLGSMIGPTTGRIRNNSYIHKGTLYPLSLNENGEHLHGGTTGISSQRFEIDIQTESSVTLIGQFNHKTDGYPGSVFYRIQFSIVDTILEIQYSAIPEEDQILNMTNHMYFNLDGSDSIHNHDLKMSMIGVYEVDENAVNTGLLSAYQTSVFDFRKRVSLGEILEMNHPQFEITRHIDHTFIFDTLCINLYGSDLHLQITSDKPVAQVYLANYFDESFINDRGQYAKNHSAIAIEPQSEPNGIHDGFDKSVIESGHEYKGFIRYELKQMSNP